LLTTFFTGAADGMLVLVLVGVGEWLPALVIVDAAGIVVAADVAVPEAPAAAVEARGDMSPTIVARRRFG